MRENNQSRLASVEGCPSGAERRELIVERHGNRLFRVCLADGRSVVRKEFGEPGAREPQAYVLLQRLGVPTIAVYSLEDDAIALEDLESSSATLRLAAPADLCQADTGRSLARWYRTLHAAGRRLLSGEAGDVPGWLNRETDVLTPDSLAETARILSGHIPQPWRLAVDSIEAVLNALHRLPITLTYNDFYWGNLAIGRGPAPSAVMFDYHLLGVGLVAADVRNVSGGLDGAARTAFEQSYGPVDPHEVLFDRPLSVLVALHHAARRERWPSWATPLMHQARSGVLQTDLEALQADLEAMVERM